MHENKKLIIFTHGGGRFANQMISYAHLIAFIIETHYQYDLINLAFFPYAHLLDATANDSLCTFPTKHQQWKQLAEFQKFLNLLPIRLSQKLRINFLRILYFYGYLTSKIQSIIAQDASQLTYIIGHHQDEFDLNNSKTINYFEKAQITLLAGWNVRSWTLFKKHEDFIRRKLTPRVDFAIAGKLFIDHLRQHYTILVGVLIRQADYRSFAGGKYFFDTIQYVDWMHQVRKLFSSTDIIGYVVASDEAQDIQFFKNLNVYFATGIEGGKGHYLESMVELSLCDLIMTPPSTFSIWAAFLGNIPMLPLYTINQVVTQADILHYHIYDALKHPHLSIAVM